MGKKQDLKNYKIEHLVAMSLSSQRTLEQREKALKGQKAKLDEINSLIKKKQKEEGLSDKDMEDMRKRAKERFNTPDVCPL
ncbi:MAG: hypothetical protein NT001_06185 [Candidatus Woesearchaeota archaeon]|nr:hypothetical protein [Candidatus Woesearchaeota archaeon]